MRSCRSTWPRSRWFILWLNLSPGPDLRCRGLDKLTAPADLTHAALFVNSGVLTLKHTNGTLSPEGIRDRMIEIRALTIALTDKLAERLADGLGMSLEQVPFTCILEGGTDRAGSHILEQAPENLRDLGEILNPGAVFWLPFGA